MRAAPVLRQCCNAGGQPHKRGSGSLSIRISKLGQPATTMVQRAVLLLCAAALDIAAASPGELLDNGSLAERLASTETVVDQLLSMMEALQEQIAGSTSAQKEPPARRKLSGSTETGYLGWDGVNFYIQGGGLAMDDNSLTVSGRDVKTSLEALDNYFALPWNMGIAFHAVKTTDQDTIASGDVVTFDTELLDVGNGYDPSTSVYTVPSFGLYRIDIMIKTGTLTTDFRLFVNGVDMKLSAWTEGATGASGQGGGGSYSPRDHTHVVEYYTSRASLNAMLYLDKDDQVKLINNVADVDAEGDESQYHTYFSGALVGKPHVTTALDHALCFSPACRLSDFVGSLNAELEMGATCTVGDGQCT